MKVALGLKAHSGWAALVGLGARDGEPQVVERRRMELVEKNADWAKQPYHAAEDLEAGAARAMVERGVEAARRVALREMRAAVERLRGAGHEVSACAVLTGEPMPDWTVDQILAVHFRMHRAEGVLFRDVLARAAAGCGLRYLGVPERGLDERAARSLGEPAARLRASVACLGKAVGPPWGRDQKDAALAALIALRGRRR